MAFDRHEISLQTPIQLRVEGESVQTTLGRSIFNDALPANYPFVNYEVGKKQLGGIVNDLAERYTKVEVAASLDALKDAGFHWADRQRVVKGKSVSGCVDTGGSAYKKKKKQK